jgi:hypothetical protein
MTPPSEPLSFTPASLALAPAPLAVPVLAAPLLAPELVTLLPLMGPGSDGLCVVPQPTKSITAMHPDCEIAVPTRNA